MSKRFFIEFSFRGTNYHGWQIQPNALSLQEIMEKSLSDLLREGIKLTGAGRTDTGVHASYFVAHFDTMELADPDQLVRKLNRYLDNHISVFRIIEADADAHARFSALNRTYKYVIFRKKQPFLDDLGYLYQGKLDIDRMNEASEIIKQTEDFSSFAKMHSNNKTNRCRIIDSYWEEKEKNLVFTIRADRFLRNMVRSITGTILDVGKAKLDLSEFRKIITSGVNQKASASAPAKGLYLSDIEYPEEYNLQNPAKNSFLPFNW